MRGKDKTLAIGMLFLVLAFGGFGCSARVASQSNSRIVTAQDGGKEEVLSDDDDEFPPRRDSGPDTKAGEFLVVLGYIGMILGSAVLPFLLL